MSRTRAAALVLVNWKGVFYERYLLDRHVTALEGANGAGKTTVMIAAYVVLLPDMSRLRFTNLGESGATGGDKGIWGRLGEPGRPSYAAIDFALAAGGRLVAGVHLERKGEPALEPTPFVIRGLAEDVRLQDLMLLGQGEREVVPELTELGENAARLGGRLQVFASAREYFLALFDEGVTPLRLGTDEERQKLNDMLRTSMTGGISRALTSELRGFLLKEESGLASTLQRMRANLDACRRTRTEVHEAQRLEQEIGGVFEAGQAMFTAAFLATRERAEDLERRVAEAEAARVAAAGAFASAEEALARIVQEAEVAQSRRTGAAEQLELARELRARLEAALAAAREVDQRRRDLAQAVTGAVRAAAVREEAGREKQRRRGALRRAQETHKLAAGGLANVQSGIEELHRRAAAYHQSTRRLRQAEAHLGVTAIVVEHLDRLLTECHAHLDRVDKERRTAAALLSDADDHRRRHAEVLEALRVLVGGEVAPAAAHEVAREALRRHHDHRTLAGRVGELGRAREEADRMARRQGRAQAQALALGIAAAGAPGAELVGGLLDASEAERAGCEEAERAARAALIDVERIAKEQERRQRELTAREPEWRALDASARRIGEHLGAALGDRPGLDRARAALARELAGTRTAEEALRGTQERLLLESRELLAAGGPFDPELLRLKEHLGAEMLAASFEDVDLEQAGRLEARLGPMAQALVVEEPRAAAQLAGARAETVPELWLVPRGAGAGALVDDVLATGADPRDVLVEERTALRVSRIPARPRLGRRAREQRAAELRSEADTIGAELEARVGQRRRLERLLEDGEALLASHPVWLAGDPAPELQEVRQQIAQLEGQAGTHQREAGRQAEAARVLRTRIDGLRALLAEAFLFDPPDHAARGRALDGEHRAALAAQAEVARTAVAAALVEDQVAVLRTTPLSDEQVGELRQRGETLRGERDRLDAAIEALEFVRDNVEALGWSDAPARLADNQALVPALEGQLADAEAARDQAERAALAADAAHDQATARWQDADGARRAAEQQLAGAETRLQQLGIADPTEDAGREAAQAVARLEVELKAADARLTELATERGRRESACAGAGEQRRQAEEKAASERHEARPAIASWERLRATAMEHGLLGGVFRADRAPLSDIRGQVNLMQEAQNRRAVLTERLRGAQGGPALLAEMEILRDAAGSAFADAYVDLWRLVRDWLRRRLPAQVAEVDDPQEALLRLRDQLSALEERLARSENDLRGTSEDVGRGIEVHIRKARGQVTRLNRNLEGVSFGSIQAIQVRLQIVEKMEQVLRALREGAVQGLLFQGDMPIEDALDEIFRRHAGGRGGGQRLLDYREYIHLQVEIRRKVGVDWEVASPTRLSTGEAIGVGAALMMVVLTEWERDATLLRGKKSHGSLRFLFLDEANRLSHDNLGVLFDLCQTLDLQLLIAAPEVARAEGNTTYRLVRKTTGDGREEVIVTGRRTRAQA
jgi:chromosome partition protein MukB